MLRIDTVLNFLTYGIALVGFVPLFPYLAMPPRLLFPLALAGGLLADRLRYRLPAWFPTVVSLLFFLYYAAQFTRDNVVGPAVNLLVVLLSIRLLGEKTARTCLQVFALALFAFTSSSLFDLSPIFILYLCLILLLIAVALVIMTYRDTAADPLVSPAHLRKILSVSLIMPVSAVPLMLVLFVIMPRTQFPLWNFLNVSGSRVTGFSEKVEPGSASSVGRSSNVAFRAHCPKLPKGRLYWRGIVLNTLDGSAWVRTDLPARERGGAPHGESVRQTIYPEPGRTTHLVALNVPWSLSGVRSVRADDHTFTVQKGETGRIRYDAVSFPEEKMADISESTRNFYLRVPPEISPRMREQAAKVARQGKSDADKLSLMEEFYVASRLSYANTDLPVGRFPLDDFLFTSRRGNCEFFASSFATLLRLAGVPARLVAGYYGGEYNEVGGYYVVTEGTAHVWVEAFISGAGWVTVDPSKWAADFAGTEDAGRRSLVRTLAMSIDTFNYYWNLAVINYDLERQIRLAGSAGSGLKRLSLRTAIEASVVPGVITAVAAVAIVVLGRWRRSSREERILARFLRQVRKSYRKEITPDTGLHELAAALGDPAVSRFAAIYGNAVYHDRRLATDELEELERLVRTLSGPVEPVPAGRRNGRGGGEDLPGGNVDKP